jgi:hypothetical protein
MGRVSREHARHCRERRRRCMRLIALPRVIIFVIALGTASGHAEAQSSPIARKYRELGGLTGFLGWPLTPERTTPDGRGRYRDYRSGSIYWTAETGAHEVHGSIRKKWASLGRERSFLGYPVTDVMPDAEREGRYSRFEGGAIHWRPERVTVVATGESIAPTPEPPANTADSIPAAADAPAHTEDSLAAAAEPEGLPGDTSAARAEDGVERVIHDDGSVEIRYPDGSIKRLEKGGVTHISPDGTERRIAFIQTPRLVPPSLLDDSDAVAWLEYLNGTLLDTIRTLVNDPSQIDDYLEYEGPSTSLNEKINQRTRTLNFLLTGF